MVGQTAIADGGEVRPWPCRLALALAVAATLWLAWWAAGGMTREGPLKPRAGFKKIESAWMAPVPRSLRGRIDPASAVVWEDGKPLWRPTARKVVEGGEPGSCFVRRDVVVFVPSDGSDPGTNGRTYVVRGPAALPWGSCAVIGLLLAALQMFAQRRGGSMVTAPEAGTCGWSIVVFLATFAVRAVWLWLHPAYNDGFMMAKGCPYSDAHAWLELAHSLVQGFGLEGPFAAQRPLYPVLLAPWLALGGPEVVTAQLVNAATGALTATLFGGLAARTAGRLTGVGVASMVAFTGFQSAMLPVPMSETVAMCFVALALGFLLRGILSGRLWPLAVGGALFGLANLVCTFTPLVWVLSGMVAAVAGVFSRRRWTALITHGGMVAFAAVLVLGPWVLRQRTVYGVTTVSLQAAEMLYAPVSASGRYNSALVEEPAKAGVQDDPAARYRYFSEQWRKKVAADPRAYARTVATNLGEFFAAYPLEAIPLRALLLLTVAASAWRLAASQRLPTDDSWPAASGRRAAGLAAWIAAGLVGTLIASMDWWAPGWGLLVVTAGAVATRSRERRWLAMLMIVLLAGVGIMDAVTGNSITRRFWTAGEGAVIVLAVLAVIHGVGGLSYLLVRMMRRLGSFPADSALEPSSVNRFENGAAVVVVLWAMMATAWALWRNTAGPREAEWSLSTEQRDAALAQTLLRLGRAPVSLPDQRLWVLPMEFTGRGCHLGGGENIHHWSRGFAVRPQARTVAFARVQPERMLRCLQLPGEAWAPDRHGKYLVIGVRNIDPQAPLGHETEIIEALAVCPVVGDGGDEKVDPAGCIVFESSAEARRIMGW